MRHAFSSRHAASSSDLYAHLHYTGSLPQRVRLPPLYPLSQERGRVALQLVCDFRDTRLTQVSVGESSQHGARDFALQPCRTWT